MAPLLLEIEHKFSFTAAQLARALANNGHPPFARLDALPARRFTDVYYDDGAASLARAGLWLRRRNGVWGAKMRRALPPTAAAAQQDPFARTTFEETGDPQRIRELVQRAMGGGDIGTGFGTESGIPGFGLRETAQIVTARQAVRADGKFDVVFDACEFYRGASVGRHDVGEVEVEVEVTVRSGGAEAAARAHAEIGAFMDFYAWLFRAKVAVGKPVVGKLSAYFAWVKEQEQGRAGGEGETR
jgi:hypothetical protein